ncbi:MAG: hypothetical protein AAFZ07_14935 [Actinomycetota bacterium]
MTDPAYQRVISTLTTELELVDELHYRHHVCLLLLGIGDSTYLGVALDDLAAAEEELSRIDLLRAAAVGELAVRWDLDPAAARLSDLIARADETTAPPLTELRTRLRSSTAELAETRELVTSLAGEHLGAVRERREAVERGPADSYDRSGRSLRSVRGTTRLHA